MAVCAAAHCHNTSRKGFVMVRFPKDDDLRDRWLLVIGRPGWKPNENSRLCEAHFELNQLTKVRCHLKKDAVPTRFCTCYSMNMYYLSDISSSRADHTYSKQVMKLANRNSIELQLDDKCSTSIVKIGSPLSQFHEHIPSKRCWYRKRKCVKASQCSTFHAPSCLMFNNKPGDSISYLYSSKEEQVLYELLEEHVALKGELGRLTKLFKKTVKSGS